MKAIFSASFSVVVKVIIYSLPDYIGNFTQLNLSAVKTKDGEGSTSKIIKYVSINISIFSIALRWGFTLVDYFYAWGF